MKKTITGLLLFLVLHLSHISYASHVMGGDISYKCLDANGTYKVYLSLYRDCSGIPLCSGSCSGIGNCTQTVSVRGDDVTCAGNLFFTFTLVGVSVRDMAPNTNPRCTNGKSTCDNMGCVSAGSLTPGVERYDFEGTVNIGPGSGIPTSCCKVLFSYEQCCRNSVIQNITPGNFYTEAMVNRCAGTYPNCNSPVLTNEPVTRLSAGQGFIYNYGGFDPDNDSLLYYFTPSMDGYGVNASYTPPYSYNVPVPFTSPLSGNYPFGIRVDSTTGDLKFKPNIYPFSGVMAIKIDQWRRINGVKTLVGHTRRDIQIYIASGNPNNPPTLKTIPYGLNANVPKTLFKIATDSAFCFTVIANDTDYNPPAVSDTTYLWWNNTLARYGATFSPNYDTATRATNGPRLDSYKFCWKPNDSLASNNLYQFSVKALDNKCPWSGIITQGFGIQVVRVLNPNITKTTTCGLTKLAYTTSPSAYSYKLWRISLTPEFMDNANLISSSQQNMNVQFPKPGRYPVQLTVTDISLGLTKTFYDTVVIQRVLKLNNDTSFCSGNTAITLKQDNPEPSFNKFRWYNLPDTNNVIDTNITLSLNINTNQSILLKAYDTATTCFYTDTVNILMGRVKAGITLLSASQGCLNNNVFKFKNTSADSAGNVLKFLWTFTNGDTTSKKDSVTKSFTTPGNQSVKLLAYTNSGCKDSTILNAMVVFPNPKALFGFGNDSAQCYNGNQFNFNNQSSLGTDTLRYLWRYSGWVGDTTNAINGSKKYNMSGAFAVKLFATSSNNCMDSFTRTVVVKNSPTAVFKVNDSVQCMNSNLFAFTNWSYSQEIFNFKWDLGDLSTDTAVDPVHHYSATGAYHIKLVVTGTLGNCTDSMEKTMIVNTNPIAGFVVSGDTAQCENDNSFAFSNQSQAGSDSITSKWSFGNGNVSTVVDPNAIKYNAPGSYPVKLVVATYAHNCKDSISRMVTVYPVAKASFTVNDSDFCAQEVLHTTSTAAIASGAFTQVWEFGDQTADTALSPMHIYSVYGNYPLKLKTTTDKQCKDSVSKQIAVHPVPQPAFAIDDSIQCNHSMFLFSNHTNMPMDTFNSYWNFGDGDVLMSYNAGHAYNTAGTYPVSLRIVSDHNCKDSVSRNLYVLNTPATPVITGDTVTPKLSTKVYSVPSHTNSVYTWAVFGDSLSPDTFQILPVIINQISVTWSNKDQGGVGVVETDSNGCSSDTAYVLVGLSPRAGLANVDWANNIVVFPQPAQNKLMLQGNTEVLQTASLYSIEGKLLMSYSHENIQQNELDVNGIQTGVYLLHLIDKQNRFMVKKVSIVK